MKAIIDFIRSEPVGVAAVIAAAIGLAVAFGLQLSPAQKAAIDLFVGAALAIIVRQNVSPTATPAAAPVVK